MRRHVFFALLLLLVVVAPAAIASHNTGHRYLVTGRVLDAVGMPVQRQEVEIRLLEGSKVISSIVTMTDCLGDFDAWRGQRGPENESPRPRDSGYGEVESFQTHDPPYVNFHFHDNHLSRRLKFQLTVGEESWTEGFDPSNRQTIVHHQLSGSFGPACESFDEFNTTLTVRVFVTSEADFNGVEGALRSRSVSIAYAGSNASGSTNFINEFVGALQNATTLAGEITVGAEDVGEKSIPVTEEVRKFRRAEGVYITGRGAEAAFGDDFRNFAIFVGIVLALGVGWYGTRKFRARMEEKRLRQTSTRRRFRRNSE